MARSRGPRNLVARRSSFHERADGDARHSYDGMIERDLGGRRATSYRAIDEGRPLTAAQLLMRPLSLFLMACTAFVVVLVAWAWQHGVFGAAHFSLTPPKPRESPAWMGARPPAPPVAAAPVQAAAPIEEPADTAEPAPDDAEDEPSG